MWDEATGSGGRRSKDKGEGTTGGKGEEEGDDCVNLTLTQCVSCCICSRSTTTTTTTTTTGAELAAGSVLNSGDGKRKGVDSRDVSEAQLLLSLLQESYEHIDRSEEYERRLEKAIDRPISTANSNNNSANINHSSFAIPTRALTTVSTADSVVESKDNNTQHTEHIQITDPDHPTTLTGRPSITLTRINLTLHPGQLVAIVGQVGSGKSSLIHTILGEMNSVYGNI